MLSPTSRLLAEELLRLSTLLQRAAAPADVIAAVRGDPEHPLRPAFRRLDSDRTSATRLAALVNRMQLEQGLSPPGQDDQDAEDAGDHQQRCRALAVAAEQLTAVCAEHWPAIAEANGEAFARQLVRLLDRASRAAR